MRRRLAIHAVLLALVLVALQVVVGTDGLISADEGAMVAELDLLERTGEWTAPNPEPEVDPDMLALPLELSERSAAGRWAPFAKHPAHIAVLAPLWDLGGYGGVLVASVLGVVAAAVAAGLLARRLSPGAEVAALWVTGIGSPLVFDGFQVVGHAVGAGLFGLAAVAALAALDAERRGAAALALLAVGLVAGAALVRTEAVLAGVALGVALGALGVDVRRRAAALGGAMVLSAVAVRLGEPRLVRGVLGADSLDAVATAEAASGGGLAGRWSGFKITVVDAGYGVEDGEVFLLVSVVLGVAAALAWRSRADVGIVRMLAVASAGAAVARMFTADFLVPGLLMAMPLLAVAVASLRSEHLRPRDASILWVACGLFAVAVIATQYETGGTGEWGGRYFAIGLPLLVAASVHVLSIVGASMPASTRRTAAGALGVVSLTLAVGAVRAADHARAASAAVADAVIAEVDRLDVEATVSARGAVSRFAWDDVLDGRRWFTTGVDHLPVVAEALAVDGVERVAVVLPASTEPDGVLGDGWQVETGREVRPGTLVAVATNTRSPE